MKASFVLIFFSGNLWAQRTYDPLNHQLKAFNSRAQPDFSSDDDEIINEDHFSSSVYPSNAFLQDRSFRNYPPVDSSDAFLEKKRFSQYSWFRRKLLYENFIIIDTGKFYATIDPLFNVSLGRESSGNLEEDRDLYNNTRGILLRASLGKKLAIESYFYENQSKFPVYINNFVLSTEVVPGQGRVKNFKKEAFDYAMSGAYVSYAPNRFLSFQFGHHKNFIGDGHRSLILSDNSFNYPFLRINTRFFSDKLRYYVIYALHQDLIRTSQAVPSEAPFERKAGSYHVLEYQVNKKFRVSLLQGIIWPFEEVSASSAEALNALNPLIFSYPLVEGLDDKNNALVGLGFDYWLGNHLEIYGQGVVDDNAFENLGGQLGGRFYYDQRRGFLQLEGNWVSADTYWNMEEGIRSSFIHYNEGLAHPLGDDFEEMVLKASYRIQRFVPFFQLNYMNLRSPVSHPLYVNLEMAYLLNPATNLKVFFSYTNRRDLTELPVEQEVISTNIIYFGIKTDLRNIYYDF